MKKTKIRSVTSFTANYVRNGVVVDFTYEYTTDERYVFKNTKQLCKYLLSKVKK